MHYVWHMAGAVYLIDDVIILGGDRWGDEYMYEEGDGSSYYYIESRVLDEAVYMYGYCY